MTYKGNLSEIAIMRIAGYNTYFMGVCFRILFMTGTDHIDAFKPVDRSTHADYSRLQLPSGTHLDLLPSLGARADSVYRHCKHPK